MEKKLKIIREFKNALINEANIMVKDVILFGSQEKNTSIEESDYDILIIIDSENTNKVREIVSVISFDLYMKYEIILNILIALDEEVKTLNIRTPLIDDAVNEGEYL
jgi:predicted nucleotidyltransferase